jgi:bacillithiol biosynthesis cysteine-adding enzyme BshC
LKDYHSVLGITESQINPVEKFSNPDTLVIVTGQQLGIYGGPLYTIYKTITTILLAEKWEKKLNRPVVPVFWLADEDHDFEEIASVNLPGNDGKISIKLDEVGTGIPVSEEHIEGTFSKLNQEVKEVLHETDFSSGLWSQLEECYQQGESHAFAFAHLICSWFSKYGLLVAGSNHKGLKSLLKDTFKTSVQNADEIHTALESQSSLLEQSFHRQVIVGDSNLFLLGDSGRSKLHRKNDNWIVDDLSFTKEKLLSVIDQSPEKFSPNVFLRPIIQDVLLPTIGYVAGPGELAYYAQMKTYYEEFGMEMPIIFPRISATLLESGIDRIMEKLPFEMCSYNQRIEDLESKYIELNSSTDVDDIFKQWASQLKDISNSPINQIQEIDASLKGAAGKLITGFENDINKFKGRVIRSIKQQEETQLKRIARIKSQLFPDGLQERAITPIYFMNKYGLDIWDRILEDFSNSELDLGIHHIIKL